MLTIVVHLVRGAYEASGPDQVTAEWPPHPARVVAALVDAAELGDPEERAAIEELCAAAPPVVVCPESSHPEVARSNFVVTNKRESESTYANHFLRTASGTRTWPRTLLAGADLRFGWDGIDDVAEVLDRIAARIPYFGRSTSPAVVRVERSDEVVTPDSSIRWAPITDGIASPLRCPTPGYLDLLERAHRSGMSAHEVPTAEVEYSDRPVPTVDPAASAGYSPTLLIKRLGTNIDGRRIPELTTLLRRAFLAHLSTRIPLAEQPAVLCGHPNLGESTWRQVMFLAFPFVGAAHADAMVKGLGLALPDDIDRRWRAEALQAWRSISELTLGSRGVVRLHEAGPDAIWTLRSRRWTDPSQVWTSATPIVPNRFCSSRAQKVAYLVESCADAGLPAPNVEVLGRSPVEGALHIGASRGTRRPGEVGRPNFHARLEFDSDVAGPIVLGDLRHYGLGLFVPSASTQTGGS